MSKFFRHRRCCALQILLLCLLATAPAMAEPLRRGLGPEPDSLDIHQAQGLAALQVLRDTHEGLLSLDAAGELMPGVAQSWRQSDDGLRLEFTLREDAQWSNGDPLTADDFLRGWQRALAPESQARTASLLLPVRGAQAVIDGRAAAASLAISAPDAHTVVIELERPTPWFLELLTHPVTYPLHAQLGTSVRERPVNGAFLLEEHVPRAYLRLRRNPRFHSVDEIALEQVEYVPIEDPGTELSQFRAGALHITETIPPGRHDWLAENYPDALRVAPYMGSFWLGLNLSRPPLADKPGLRRALSLAIDRDILTRVVMGAGEQPAWSLVPDGLAGYQAPQEPALRWSDQQRLQRARRLYERAGYSEQKPLRIQLRFNTSATHRRMAVAVAAMWKQSLGVRTELLHEEWKVFVNNRAQGTVTQVFRGGWIADYADPVSFLDLFRSDDPLNSSFYRNDDYDRLLQNAATASAGQRLALLRQAEQLLLRDTPVIPLYTYVSRHLVDPRVRGFINNPRDAHLSRHLTLGAP